MARILQVKSILSSVRRIPIYFVLFRSLCFFGIPKTSKNTKSTKTVVNQNQNENYLANENDNDNDNWGLEEIG